MANNLALFSSEDYDDGLNNAVLHQHKFEDGDISISFHSYYNDATPILYELEPFIKPLRLSSCNAAIKLLPEAWVRLAGSLGDTELFKSSKISTTAVFVQVQSIQYLLNILEDRGKLRKFIAHLYDWCLSDIENDRRVRERRIIQHMRRENEKLKTHTEHHATAFDVIHETLHLISERHMDIKDAIAKLLETLVSKAIKH